MQDSIFNKLVFASLLVVLLTGFWLRTSGLEQYPPGVSNDEAKNLIDSVYIAQTGRTPFYEDEGRPEPINRLVAAVGSRLYGNSIWAFRLTSAFWGVLTLATVYWTATQCFFDVSPNIRKLAGLTATIALTIALGHITVTRSLYRAVPLPFFTLLAIGFTARGLRTYQWRDFFWVGVFLSLGIYTYTSGFIVPLVFLPLGLILLIFHRENWRQWLPRLMLTGIVLATLTSPVIYLLFTQPSAVLARASDVAGGGNADFSRKIELMIGQFFTQGDENPQYNVANAPIIAQIFIPFFFVGLGALILRFRQPSSVIIAGLLFLNTIPVLLTDEITHGLRIYSEFAIVPLIIGASVVLILTMMQKLSTSQTIKAIGLLLILSIGIYQVVSSHQIYVNFWEDADTQWRKWVVYDRELSHSEWFFRSDRLTLTNWIKAQNTPLLMPVEELYRDAQRGMLMSHYPNVTNMDENFLLPDNTQVIIPWSLENGDFLDNSTHFALLDNATITLLSPITLDSQSNLLQNIDNAISIENTDSNIPIVGKVFAPPDNITLDFMQPSSTENPLAVFNDELEIIQWYGNDTISEAGETIYTIDWSVNRPVSHEYGVFIQLLTQDWERITGDEQLLLRWLYPTIAWQPQQIIPDNFKLDIPSELPAGAYRLVAGTWYVNSGEISAQSFIGDTVNKIATIGWIKVPQKTEPVLPTNAITIDATLNNQFQLTHAEISSIENKQLTIKLYWKSLVDRPQIDATVFVHALDEDHSIVAQSDTRPWNGQYPTFIWDEDEIIVTEHQLAVANSKDIQIVAGMYTQPDFTRLPATQNGEHLHKDLIQLGNFNSLIEK
jgi:4-amino-4-deoxy-L-arabinose transferase-like glycosyltransferase